MKSLCLLSALAVWQGCSSSSDSSDAATNDAANNTDGPAGSLSRGMNCYKITAVSGVTDGCDIGAAGYATMNIVLPVSFTESTQILTVGNIVGTPPMPSLGSGVIGVTGTLMRENSATDGSGCSWHQKDVSIFTLTGADVFTLDVTETQSAFNACTPTPAGGTCTSLYKLTLSKTSTTPGDGGTCG